MADHVNISHPDGREERMAHRIREAELKARISVMESYMLEMNADLNAIFTRIERGHDVELHYRDGTVVHIVDRDRANG